MKQGFEPMNASAIQHQFVRHSVSIGGYWFAYGAFYSLYNLYLKNTLGFNTAQVATVLSFIPLVTIFAPALWGYLYKRLKNGRHILTVAISAVIATLVLIPMFQSMGAQTALVLVFAVFNSSIKSLQDGRANQFAQETGQYSFGRIRMWGSIGWVIATAAAGFAFKELGFPFVVGMSVFAYAACMISNLGIRRAGVPAVREKGEERIWRTAGARQFIFFVLFFSLNYGVMYAMESFIGLHLYSLGAPESLVGVVAAGNAGVEAVLMVFSARFFISRIRAKALWFIFPIGMAALHGFIALSPSLPVVIAAVVLKGLIQGLAVPGMVLLVSKLLPHDDQVFGLSLLTSVGYGLITFITVFAGGQLAFATSLPFVFLLTGGVMLLSLLFYPFVFKEKEK